MITQFLEGDRVVGRNTHAGKGPGTVVRKSGLPEHVRKYFHIRPGDKDNLVVYWDRYQNPSPDWSGLGPFCWDDVLVAAPKPEPSRTIKPGDIVRLKSGGPAMTVERFDKDGDAVCAWFTPATYALLDSSASRGIPIYGSHPTVQCFAVEALELANPK